MKAFFNKYKEVILYLFFGVLTMIVSIASFYIFSSILKMHELIANILSWICAVLFAYITNSKWVFNSTEETSKSLIKFFSGRLFTLGIEELILYIFVTVLNFDALVIKTIAQVAVIVLNYVISKWFVFR